MEISKPLIRTYCRECKQNNKHDVCYSEIHLKSIQDDSPRYHTDDEGNQVLIPLSDDEYIENIKNGDIDSLFLEHEKYQIVQCRGCETVTFRIEDQSGKEIQSYPKKQFSFSEIETLPRNLKYIVEEVEEAYNNGLLTLCAAGIRTIIEGICIEEKAIDKIKKDIFDKLEFDKNAIQSQIVSFLPTKKRGLQKQVKDIEDKIKVRESWNDEKWSIFAPFAKKVEVLVDKNKILPTHAAILTKSLQDLGNKALHELETPTSDEVKTALEILKHLLTTIYKIEIDAQKLDAKKHNRRNNR
jgi:Domain of unknown function (DUF4145)